MTQHLFLELFIFLTLDQSLCFFWNKLTIAIIFWTLSEWYTIETLESAFPSQKAWFLFSQIVKSKNLITINVAGGLFLLPWGGPGSVSLVVFNHTQYGDIVFAVKAWTFILLMLGFTKPKSNKGEPYIPIWSPLWWLLLNPILGDQWSNCISLLGS